MRIAAAIVSATVLSAVSALAQSTAPAPAVPKPMAFVGCLEHSRRAITPESSSFVLNTPVLSNSAAEAKKGTPEDPAANAKATIPPLDAGDTGRAEAKIANLYVLDGSSAELSKHVGHKVEITGVLKPADMDARRATSAGAATAQAAVPHLQVAAIKMVAMSCSGS